MKPERYLPRLSFIRYLYTQALDNSKEPEPQFAASILSLHDTVELLLDLVCDFLGTNRAKDFSDYWNLLEEKVPTILGHKRDMLKLNRIRVDLKHHGIIPAKAEIVAAAVNVTSFMEDIVLTVFGIKFEEVSMTDLVQNVESKEKLNLATQEIKIGSVHKALFNIAIAFQEVINEYEEKRTKEYGKSPFYFAHQEFVRMSTRYEIDEDHQRALVDTILSLQNAVQIMALGIDYQKYTRFKLLTPDVYLTEKGWTPDIVYQFILDDPKSGPVDHYKPTQEDCQFCIDFVIETAIRLQASYP